MIKKCILCYKNFNFRPYRIKTAKFCSDKCKYIYRRKRIEKYCVICKKTFYIPPNKIKKGHKNFCSDKCASNYHSIYWRGEKHHRFINGKTKTSTGYILINNCHHPHKNKNYIREHRFIIEQQIGRYLLPKEEVHHINKKRDDNRLSNLMAFSSKSAHQKFEHNRPIKIQEIIFDGRKVKH